MPNNDIFYIFSSGGETEKIYIYGLKSSGEVYFNDNEENIREINPLLFKTNYINSAGLIINNKQYIFICITNYECESNCHIIDYETNNNYNENLYKLLKYDNRDDFHKAGRMFTILNLNQQNKILLSYLEENSIDFSIINLLEEDFSSYDIIKNSKRNDILLNSRSLSDLNCFITEKKFIECFILHPSGADEGDLLKVEIFDESLNHLDYIIVDNLTLYRNTILAKCIHLKKEIGVFGYYPCDTRNIFCPFYIEINELIFDGSHYIFKNVINDGKLQCKFLFSVI